LSNLVFSTGALIPTFAPGTTIYTQSVASTVTSLTITPTAADPTATIRVNNVIVSSGASSPISLNLGSNPINITVTAADGTTQSYTVTVTRTASKNANLSSLVFDFGSLSPSFSPDTTNYTLFVPFFNNSVTVTPTAADPAATITINGVTVASGSPFPISSRATVIDIRVTAQDGTTTKLYFVIIQGNVIG
jgi:hypothetical protein